jgi:acyl carrier protein
MLKRGPAVNELSKFRGDVVIRVGVGTAPAAPKAAHAHTLQDVRTLLASKPDVVALEDVKDARIDGDLRIREVLVSSPAQSTVRDLRAAVAAMPVEGIDPELLATLDPEYDVTLLWPRSGVPGRFDAELRRRGTAHLEPVGAGAHDEVARPWAEFVHHAAQQAFTLDELTRLRAHLGATLPDYMIPSAFVRMDVLPLTPSGKVDRKALRPPAVQQSTRRYVAPRTPTEEALASLWAEVLRIERVGVDDGFLDLGGHSLLAMRILGRVRRQFGVTVPLDPLLRGDSVAQLAVLLDQARAEQPAEEDEFALAPISRDAFRRSASTEGAS